MSREGEKTILVTGCTSGIGYATAGYLHEMGYHLVLTGRNKERLHILAKSLDCEAFCVCDFHQKEQVDDIFTYIQERKIKLDGMVHCAGYSVNAPVRMFKEADMQGMMQLHFYAFMRLAKLFYKRSCSNSGASIVTLSSFSVVACWKGSAMYAASKSAMDTAVKVMAKEFAKRKIRVNAILPAYVETRMAQGIEAFLDVEQRQPFGLIEPRQIAYLTEFLLSEKSRFITGALIPVSAGMEGSA